MKLSIFISLLFVLFTSCGTIRHNNFNKQKFTTLKQVEHQAETNLNPVIELEPSEDTLKHSECDTLFLTSGKSIECTIISETDEEIEFTGCPPNDKNFKINTSQIERIGKIITPEKKVELEVLTCDQIFLKNGDTLNCQILKEEENTLKYTKCPSNNITYSVNQEEIIGTSNAQEIIKEKTNSKNHLAPIILGTIAFGIGLIVILGLISIGGWTVFYILPVCLIIAGLILLVLGIKNKKAV